MSIFSSASIAVAIFSGLIFYFGKITSKNRVLPTNEKNTYMEGFLFTLFFVLMPTSLVVALLFFFKGLMNVNSYFIIALVSLSVVVLIVNLFSMQRRLKKTHIRVNSNKIIFKTFLGAFWLVLSCFLIYFVSPESKVMLTTFASLSSFGGLTYIAMILSETEQNFKDVIIRTEDDEYQGILFDVSNDGFYRIQNNNGIFSINKDKIKSIIDTDNSFSKKVLMRSEGSHSAFNKVIRSDNLNENVERLKGDFRNWLKNAPFDEFKKQDIDVAIVYQYTDDNHALDGDNLVKPIISTLENHDEGDFYLVEDDSQIKKILVKTEKTDSLMQDNVKIDLTDRGQWREAHGRVIVSFRKHSEKPMRLVHGGPI